MWLFSWFFLISFPFSSSISTSSYLSSFLCIFSLYTYLEVMLCPYTFSGHSDTPTRTVEPADLRPTVPPPPAILMISILHTNVVSYFSSVMCLNTPKFTVCCKWSVLSFINLFTNFCAHHCSQSFLLILLIHLINSFNKYLICLNICWINMPGTVLGGSDREVNKTKSLFSSSL